MWSEYRYKKPYYEVAPKKIKDAMSPSSEPPQHLPLEFWYQYHDTGEENEKTFPEN